MVTAFLFCMKLQQFLFNHNIRFVVVYETWEILSLIRFVKEFEVWN